MDILYDTQTGLRYESLEKRENEESIYTEAGKRQLILEAVTLKSCDGDTNEQRLKIERLSGITDDLVMDYVLNAYVRPYRDYKENRKVLDRDTLIDTNQFLKIVGYHSDFVQFCCNCFRIPFPEDDLTILEENKQRCLSTGRTQEEEK